MTIKKKGEILKFSHISDLVEETKYWVVDTSLTQNIVVKIRLEKLRFQFKSNSKLGF